MPPPAYGQASMAANPAAVQAAVNGPAIFMMVLAGLNIAFALFSLVMNLFFGSMGSGLLPPLRAADKRK